MKQKLNEIAK